MTAFVISFVFIGSADVCVAQQDSTPTKYSVIAARYCQEKDYAMAISEIEQAIKQENEVSEVYTWYIRGFIYKEVYKMQPSKGALDVNRELAVESFLKAKSLNDQNANSNNDAALKYLAATYFNDALAIIDDYKNLDMELADMLFSKYELLMTELNLTQNLTQSHLEVHQAKGQRYIQFWNANHCDKNSAQFAIRELSEALLIDPADCTSQYNLAVVYYGIGFDSSDSMAACWSYDEISQFRILALSRLLSAESICDQSVEIKTALLNIYRFQKDSANTMLYERKLNSLIQQNSTNHK